MLNTVYIMYVIYIFYEMVNLLVPNSVIVTKKYFNRGCLQNAINWWRCCCISWNSGLCVQQHYVHLPRHLCQLRARLQQRQVSRDVLNAVIHSVPKKHVTTFLMINWIRTVRLQRFLAHWEYRPSTDIFSFLPHLLSAATLPWKTVET